MGKEHIVLVREEDHHVLRLNIFQIPLYWLTKCAFLVWCMSPLNGAKLIYESLILPRFRANESQLDKEMNHLKETAGQGTIEDTKFAQEVPKDMRGNYGLVLNQLRTTIEDSEG